MINKDLPKIGLVLESIQKKAEMEDTPTFETLDSMFGYIGDLYNRYKWQAGPSVNDIVNKHVPAIFSREEYIKEIRNVLTGQLESPTGWQPDEIQQLFQIVGEELEPWEYKKLEEEKDDYL